MSIQFEWQTRNDDGEWETVSPGKRRRRVPRWAWLAVLATVLVLTTAATLVIRRRYHLALDRITFQIQSVIDLEAQAFADGDVERFLAQQDQDAGEWYAARQRLVESGPDHPDAAQQGTLPAKIQDLHLQEDVAWVEVVEDNAPVRRMRFYRQTDRGWLHTASDPAFWGVPVEVHYDDQLIVRYHRQDNPHVKALADRLGQAYYTTCLTVTCPKDRPFEVAFYVQMPADYPPRHVLLLPSPWIDGIPLEGTYAERAAEKSLHALTERVVLASLSNYVIPRRTLQAAMADEYAAWVSTNDLAQAPLLRRVIARHGTQALPELFLWLEQRHTTAGFLSRWLGLMPEGGEIPYFEALIELERDALYAGRRDSFLMFQDDGKLKWLRDQKARFDQFHGQEPSTRPDIDVQMVEIGGDRARVTFGSAGQSAAFAQSPAFFRYDGVNWAHTHPPYAPYTGYMPVPPAVPSGNVVTVRFACWFTTDYQRLVDVFHQYYGAPGMRITDDGKTRRYSAYPGIRVEFVDLAAHDWSTSSDQLLGEAPTFLASLVDAGEWPWLGWIVTPEAMQDLGPFIEADGSFDRGDFYPHMIEAYRQGDSTLILPMGGLGRLIFYDKRAFDAAGEPHPYPGWTHEDFMHAARSLTSRSGDAIERYGFVDLVGGWREFVLAHVEQPDEGARLAVPDLTAPDVVRAVRWYADLALEHSVMPNPNVPLPTEGEERAEQELRSLVSSGKAAMWSDEAYNVSDRDSNADLGVVPFPVGRRQVHYYWSRTHLYMSQAASHPEAAWVWLRFLTHQETPRPSDPVQASIPARRSVAEAIGYWSQWNEEAEEALRYALEYGTGYRWDASIAALSHAIDAVLDGTPVEEALAEAQASLESP
jgi:multiple sugar transport system substrate-binding protein